MATILEALQAAEINIGSMNGISLAIAKSQLHNAVVLLEKGYSIYEDIENIIDKHGSVENAPEWTKED